MTDATATVTIREEPTLRDRFAMAALAGLLTPGDVGKEAKTALIAEAAYAIADAMLEARKPKAGRGWLLFGGPGKYVSGLEQAVSRLEASKYGIQACLMYGADGWRIVLPSGRGQISRNIATAINAALDEAEKAGM